MGLKQFYFIVCFFIVFVDQTLSQPVSNNKIGDTRNGYYDRNMNWHEINPARDIAYYNTLDPRPVGFLINGTLSGTDDTYLATLPATSGNLLRQYMSTLSLQDIAQPLRQADGSWIYAYRLGGLVVPVPHGMGPDDRFALKAGLLALRPSDVAADFREVLSALQRDVNSPGFNNLLLREYSCDLIADASRRHPGQNCTPASEAAGYAHERLRYLINGYRAQVQSSATVETTYHLSSPPRRASGCPEGADSANYQFSLTPFKKGDLDRSCKERVDRGVADGFQRITMFFPIHYSGGNLGSNPYGDNARDMTAGWDYRYEDANGIDQEELHRCLEYINAAGLELNYVPHLESIVTMNSSGESEWRIHSSIPVNREYYQRAYGGLLSYLANHPAQARSQHIRVAAAAELDPSFVGNTDASLDMTRRLRRELQALGTVPEISWMPNGDFNNGWSATATHHVNCDHMAELLQSVDRIAPSLYQEYGHLYDSAGNPATGSDVSLAQTREHFFHAMGERFRSLCPSQASELERIARSRSFSVGEFGLTTGNYTDFAQQMRASGEDVDATFWNSGSWDHAGIAGAASDPVHEAEIAATTTPCAPVASSVLTETCPHIIEPLPRPEDAVHIDGIARELDGRRR